MVSFFEYYLSLLFPNNVNIKSCMDAVLYKNLNLQVSFSANNILT